MDNEARRPILDELLAYIDAELKSRTGELLERAERTTSTAWMDIADPEKQAAARTTARWLKDNKAAVQDALYKRLLQALSTPSVPKTAELDELQMMDEETLNVFVIRARMVNKVLDRARTQIRALEKRLTSLSSDDGITLNSKALDPGNIADGYLHVLQELGVPDHARPVLMEIYGDRSIELLVHFYEGINELLIRLGVLPDLPVAKQVAVDPGLTLEGESRAGMLETDFMSIQTRIEGLPLNHWQHGKLLSIVTLQLMVMTSIHEAAVDKVEAYFVDLLKDERASQRVRFELNRLVATLFVMCMDNATLDIESPKSPIYVFVKQLSLLGMRDRESTLGPFDKITAVVGRIVSERGGNIDSFRSGAQVLYTIARGEVQRVLEQRKAATSKPAQTAQPDLRVEAETGQAAADPQPESGPDPDSKSALEPRQETDPGSVQDGPAPDPDVGQAAESEDAPLDIESFLKQDALKTGSDSE